MALKKVFGACTQVHGREPPPPGRGSGGADAWDLSRSVWPPQFGAIGHLAGLTPLFEWHVRTTTTTTTTTTSVAILAHVATTDQLNTLFVGCWNGSSPGVSGAVVEPQQMVSEGWNFVKQLAATVGLYAATLFCWTRPPRLLACLPLPLVALPSVGLALWVPVAFVFSMFRWVLRCCQPRCWLRLRCSWGWARWLLDWRLILRVWSFLRSMRLLGLLRRYLWFFFQIAATGGPAAFVPWVFVIAFAALSVVHAFKVFVRFAGRPGFTPFKDETHETTRVDMLQVTLSLSEKFLRSALLVTP